MDISSKVVPDGAKWCIEVTVLTEVALRPGVVKRKAEKIFRLRDYKTEEDAKLDEPRVREKAAKNKAFW